MKISGRILLALFRDDDTRLLGNMTLQNSKLYFSWLLTRSLSELELVLFIVVV